MYILTDKEELLECTVWPLDNARNIKLQKLIHIATIDEQCFEIDGWALVHGKNASGEYKDSSFSQFNIFKLYKTAGT